MNLIYTALSDAELFLQTKKASQTEKDATIALLEYLLEVDRRRLFSKKSYSSLFDYVVKELGYSEPAAADRVNTVRLMRAVPEVKYYLKENRLTITSAAQIQRFIKTEEKISKEKVSEPEKTSLIDLCLDQSKREVEKILYSKQSEESQILNQEKIKLISIDRSEIRFTVSENMLKKLQTVKELLGDQSLETIFDRSLDLLLIKEQKKRGMNVQPKNNLIKESVKPQPTRPAEFIISKPKAYGFVKNERIDAGPVKHGASKTNPDSRFIPINLKRFVFQRSKGQCEFLDIETKRRCGSRFKLHIDHIFPFALGGKNETTNLRHLCFAHNMRAAKNWGLN